MKIKINEKESYNVTIEKNVFEASEFLELLDRLNNISKLITKVGLTEDETTLPLKVRKSRTHIKWLPEMNIELVEAYKTKEGRENFMKKYNLSGSALSNRIIRLRQELI